MLNYKKPAFWIIVLAIVACVAVAVCFLTNPPSEDEGKGINQTGEIFTDYEGVYVTVQSIDTNAGGHTVFNLVWHNKTNKLVTYGEPYIIERKEGDEWVSTASEELYFTTIGLLLNPSSTANKSYSTQRFDVSESGTYRLRTSFLIDEGGKKEYDTWIVFEVGSIPSVSGLGEKYPHFFGLNAEDGLTVYVWQLAESNYSCYLVSTAEDRLTDHSFAFTNGASISEMRMILHSYNIKKDKVKLVPVTNPISSYYYEINDEYRKNLEARFWSEIVPIEFNTIYDTATFDIDGDGKEENCSLRYGNTSGLFTFIFSVQDKETNEIEYETAIYSQWYDLSFQKGADGITRVRGITQGENPGTHLFDISIKDGYVYLSENGIYIGEIG